MGERRNDLFAKVLPPKEEASEELQQAVTPIVGVCELRRSRENSGIEPTVRFTNVR